MATYYSEHYAPESSASVTAATAVSDPAIFAEPGLSHAPVRRKVARIDTTGLTLASSDVFRLFPLKGTDRPIELYVSSTGFTATALTANVGVHSVGDNHDGAVVDADEFASAQTIDNVARTEILDEAGTVVDTDRGWKHLWEMVGVSANPRLDYDITLSLATVTSVTVNGVILAEIFYVPGAVS